jgi:glycosyltransferase involved in cell wall biosynthesis
MMRVSVVIPVRNAAETVKRSINSVLRQTLPPSQIVVVDDGSDDATSRILSGYGDRIEVICQHRRGPSAARNAGAAAAADAEYLAFLDADDVWLPNMLHVMVNQLEKVSERVLAFCNFEAVDSRGSALADSMMHAECAHAPAMHELLMRWWPILPSATVMRRSAFETCGGFHEDFVTPGFEDPYLWILMREQGEFVYTPERLVRYYSTPAAERMKKYATGYRTFSRLVRNRYGAAGEPLIREVTASLVSFWGHEGLIALRAGDKIQARQHFATALHHNCLRMRNYLRWLRTFLPLSAAHALSGDFVRGAKLAKVMAPISSEINANYMVQSRLTERPD